MRGKAYMAENNYPLAIQDFNQALQLSPGDVDDLRDRGSAYMDHGDDDLAIQDLDQAIATDPKDSGEFNNRGLAYVGEKDYARALQDYDQAISIDPKDSDAYTNRGFDHFFLGQFAAAQSDLAIAVADSPTNRYRVLWLYLAASRAGQNSQADLETNAAKLNLTNWPGPVVQLYLGKITSAEFLTAATISDAKKNREQHCEAYFYLGEQALIAGRRIEARRLFQQSIDTGVTNFDEYDGAQTELKRLPPTTAAGSN
jgi:lipoprotein NlpI